MQPVIDLSRTLLRTTNGARVHTTGSCLAQAVRIARWWGTACSRLCRNGASAMRAACACNSACASASSLGARASLAARPPASRSIRCAAVLRCHRRCHRLAVGQQHCMWDCGLAQCRPAPSSPAPARQRLPSPSPVRRLLQTAERLFIAGARGLMLTQIQLGVAQHQQRDGLLLAQAHRTLDVQRCLYPC